MSVEFVILSPLTPSELAGVAASCRRLAARWHQEHEDTADGWGKLELGGSVPSASEAANLVRVDGAPAPPEHPKTQKVLQRLETIRSALTVERPGNVDLDPVHVSISKYLLEHSGSGLAVRGDAIELNEDALRELEGKAEAPGFGAPAAGNPGADQRPAAEDAAPGTVAVREFLRSLVADEQLELLPEADITALAERLLKFLEEADVVGIGGAVSEWLVDQPETEELYADDASLEAALRRHLAG